MGASPPAAVFALCVSLATACAGPATPTDAARDARTDALSVPDTRDAPSGDDATDGPDALDVAPPLDVAAPDAPPDVSPDAPAPTRPVRWSPPPALAYDPPGRRYAYAPSVVVEGDTTHIWACANTADGVIRDHVLYIQRRGGAVVTTSVALAPSASGWDSFHNCDPAVVAGHFVFAGADYAYAMFYLGNDVDASAHNAVGVAFAHALTGPWVKAPGPVIPFPAGDAPSEWGVGQPSATSVDGNGRVLLFYTQGDHEGTRTYRRDVNLHDAAAPSIGPPVLVPTDGLTTAAGAPDWLNNMDVVYDPSRDRFYMVREQRPYPPDDPTFITPTLQVASIEGAAIWSGAGRWRAEGAITPALTGFARNHNAGLARTAFGTLPDPAGIDVVFASSCACAGSLWTYDLHALHGAL